MFFPIWALGESAASAAVTTAAAATPRRNRFRTRMGTEFEDENAKEKLRAMLNKQFGIGDDSPRPDEWCKATDKMEAGTVLLADPKAFTTPGHSKLLAKFGLAQPLPGADQIPSDRAADLLPVVLLVDDGVRGSMGLLLNRRTGMLMGDLGDDFKAFMIQPLWLGGTVGESGLSFLHTYPEVKGAKPLMEEEGIFFGGDIESASRVVTEGPGSGFNFRFFVQFTRWAPGELEAEMEQGIWRLAAASKMALMRVRDRKGPDTAKPMWTDLSEMAGGEYLEAMEDFYGR
eukprot:jgi/Undpi1/9310/HiC_scaffold_26.g11768.m1